DGLAQLRPRILRLRLLEHDPIDPPYGRAAVKVHVLFELFGDGFRCLDEFAVDVRHVEVSVRTGGETAGAKPMIGGRQELFVLLASRATGNETCARWTEHISMDQIPAHVTGKQVAVI